MTVKTERFSFARVEPRTDLSPAKRRQILGGARAAFCELGYERASVDAIAARAGVSKATVYNHFGDKRALYVACAADQADEMRDALRASIAAPGGDLAAALQNIGERIVTFVLSPPTVALFCHALTEACELPEVGQTLWERGPRVVYEALEGRFAAWGVEGLLRLDDPRTAAVHFVSLCEGDLVLRTRLGVLRAASKGMIRETVRRGVDVFLRAYAA